MSQTANPHGEPILERMTLAPAGKRLRAVFGGEVIAESVDALVLSETGYPPRIYFPPEGLRNDRLEPTDHATSCPWKGTAAYWTVNAGGETLKNGAWAYPTPLPELAALANHVSFYEAVTIEE